MCCYVSRNVQSRQLVIPSIDIMLLDQQLAYATSLSSYLAFLLSQRRQRCNVGGRITLPGSFICTIWRQMVTYLQCTEETAHRTVSSSPLIGLWSAIWSRVLPSHTPEFITTGIYFLQWGLWHKDSAAKYQSYLPSYRKSPQFGWNNIQAVQINYIYHMCELVKFDSCKRQWFDHWHTTGTQAQCSNHQMVRLTKKQVKHDKAKECA